MRAAAIGMLTLALSAGLLAQQPVRPSRGAAPRPAARREATMPFAAGEHLTFDVSWSDFLTAGTAVIQVVEKKASFNSTAYHIVADGRPLPLVARFYPIFYKMDTLLDSFTSLSQWTSLYQEENTRKRQTTMRFDRVAKRIFYETTTEPAAKADFAAPADVQDGLSALYTLRARQFRAGEHFTVPIADDGTVYTVQFETTGPEQVAVRAGQFDAWNLKVTIVDAGRQAVGKNIGLWISNDARRLPVKMQADLPVGSFVLGLREAR